MLLSENVSLIEDRCEHLDMHRQTWDRSPFVNQSIFNAEWTYGVGTFNSPHTDSQWY